VYGLQVEKINLKDEVQRLQVEEFLKSAGLKYDGDVDYTLIIKESELIKATCSKAGSVLKCFAVAPELRGEGVSAILVTALIDRLFEEGKYHSFVFTKPENIDVFSSLGFKTVHSVKEAALLENGLYDIEKALERLSRKYDIDNITPKAALVMNCNPFTIGHQHLIETAAKASEEVLVFIVEENRSLFPFDIRYELVKKGVSHLENVKVIPGGEYIISSATFPAYFLREESERLKAYTKLDAGIFRKHFCSRFNIVKRYVGEEPYCSVTNSYNDTLKEVLFESGVDLEIIERRKNNGTIISASIVRNLIKCGKLEEVKKIVPLVTFEFLNTGYGKEIMEKIKGSSSPH
jgi:[citrate (pro-3S)-lyase] ligase